MHLVNATWPHQDHLLLNLGIPGTAFYGFSQGGCLAGQQRAGCQCACRAGPRALNHND
jgi:hypothetical protein